MEAKKLSIQDCAKLEEKLAQEAIGYVNLMRVPEKRAEAAKEVIVALPNIKLTRGVYEQKLEVLSARLNELHCDFNALDVRLSVMNESSQLTKFERRFLTGLLACQMYVYFELAMHSGTYLNLACNAVHSLFR